MIRCKCTHDWFHDYRVANSVLESASGYYPNTYFVVRLTSDDKCPKCHMFPWELVRNKYYKRRKADV